MKERNVVFINQFEKEIQCLYKEELYSVRDNGSIFRHARKNKPKRKYDDQWTLGAPTKNGYLTIAGEAVHRIVATAFLGESPTPEHVIDHIDTNRKNNRPENLRWLTRLENILNNPITIKKIKFLCGSIEAFIDDPSILRTYISVNPNFEWMRAVTPQEAKNAWQNLKNWSEKEDPSIKSGVIGEWIYKDIQNQSLEQVVSDTQSLNPNALQRNWKTPSEFPLCPKLNSENPFTKYFEKLNIGEIFSINQFSKSIIQEFAISKDGNYLLVLCKNSNNNSIKPYNLAQIVFEKGVFIHVNLGSFFKKEGAEKQFTLAQGLEWQGEDSIDDFC